MPIPLGAVLHRFNHPGPFLGGHRHFPRARVNPSTPHKYRITCRKPGPWDSLSKGVQPHQSGTAAARGSTKHTQPKTDKSGSRSACRHAGSRHAPQWIREVPCCIHRGICTCPTPHNVHIANVHSWCTTRGYRTKTLPITTQRVQFQPSKDRPAQACIVHAALCLRDELSSGSICPQHTNLKTHTPQAQLPSGSTSEGAARMLLRQMDWGMPQGQHFRPCCRHATAPQHHGLQANQAMLAGQPCPVFTRAGNPGIQDVTRRSDPTPTLHTLPGMHGQGVWSPFAIPKLAKHAGHKVGLHAGAT
jgi:hypothetical protein